jgi:hypothetical protein
MMLKEILGPKRDEMTGDWRKLYAEELHNLYFVPNIIRMMLRSMTDRACGMHGREDECTNDFWWESQKKRNH